MVAEQPGESGVGNEPVTPEPVPPVTTPSTVVTVAPAPTQAPVPLPPTPPPPPVPEPPPEPEPQQADGCDSNYEGGCVPISSDVDCVGGSGDGPEYVEGPVYVVGDDIYGLDSNNDGSGANPSLVTSTR